MSDGASEQARRGASYVEIDKQLRRIAKKRAALDVEEATWLREAERLCIWRKLGFSTAIEYLEDVFGHTPRTAMERLRVAKELGELPGLEAELASGALSWSAARELSRVMTPATESRWLERARGKNVADIQQLVSGHKKGDDPDAPKDPALMTRRLVLELPPALDALFENVRLALEQERGEHLDDVIVFEAMCIRFLEPGPAAADGKAPKPMHRIVTYKCDDCIRAWREGRGRLVPIAPAELELAACDAELVDELGPAELATCDAEPQGEVAKVLAVRGDSLDDTESDVDVGAADGRDVQRTKSGRVQTKRRPPPTQTIPKATRDFVWARDQGRCRVPGCRATRHLTFHHLRFLSEGGDHDPANLILICDGHHKVLHDGALTITGRAPDELTFVRHGKRLVDARSSTEKDATAVLRADAMRTLSGSRADGCTNNCSSDRGTSDRSYEGCTNNRSSDKSVRKRHSFADVVKLEHAKQALMQLGFKARAARVALEAACAHVGGDLDVAMLVKAVLDQQRGDVARPTANDRPASNEDLQADATKALVQLGYSRAIASAAVRSASAHVGATAELGILIKESLRRCGTS